MKPVIIKGKVVKGMGNGKKIGLPTANLRTENDLSALKLGVYASYVRIDSNTYKSITHYGPRAVFDDYENLIEVHIFDFNEDLYSKELELELVAYIRPTLKFKNLEEMLKLIEDDKRKTQIVLKNTSSLVSLMS